LTFDAASALYRKFEPDRAADDNLLNELFEFIEYNTFAIELIAKTIHLSFDLTFESFLEYLRGQRLDEDDLDVDLEEGATNTRLLMLLNKTFDIGKLTHQDYYYMEFFAMLPSNGINLPDLVTWYGKEYEKVNKTEFARAINSLHNKGLIKRSGNDIKMDRIFQESVMYQSRKHLNPFVSQLLHVNYLAARLQEGIKGNPSQALHFLKYAQSILKNIKEPYRRSLYQPLLLLENETLYITNWLENTEVMLPLWDSLLQCAGKYLGENDAMVGIISNNYALALFGEERLEEAGVYFDKALEISNENRVSPGHLLNILSNRANVYIQQQDFKGFGKVFNDMLEIRTSNDLWDDASFPLQCHALGVANLKGRNYPSAKQMFSIAITSHKRLPVGERNDINLIMFLCNMSSCCLLLKEPELAEKAVVQAVHYLGELKITEGVPMVITIQALIAVAEDKGETDEVAKLKGILETHL
jgi:tetratricopeptide (TPR) repeat protein